MSQKRYQAMLDQERERAEIDMESILSPEERAAFKPVQPKDDPEMRCPKDGSRMLALNPADWMGDDYFCCQCLRGYTEADLKVVV